MAGITTLREIPSLIQAGDSLLFKIANSDFLASDWELSYSFRGAGGQIDFTATNDSNDHLVSVGADVTVGWLAGDYKGAARFTKRTDSTQAITWWRGSLTVNADMVTTPSGQDTRSWAKRCLDAVEAVLQNKASKDVLNTTIAGQSIGRMAPEQLLALRDRFFTLYQQELAAEAASQGRPQTSNIGIIFRLPS